RPRRLPPPRPSVHRRPGALSPRDDRARHLRGAGTPHPREGAGAEPAGAHDPALLPRRPGRREGSDLPSRPGDAGEGGDRGQGRDLRLRPPSSMTDFTSEVRDGMRIDWDVPVRMDDGLVLRADVFRPIFPGKYPVL